MGDDGRAGLPGTEEVLRLLRRASHQGEIVTLAYAQGSRPGQAKELKILEINPAEDRVMVLAVDVPAGTFAYPQEYRLSKVLWVRCIDGQRAENARNSPIFCGVSNSTESQGRRDQRRSGGSARDQYPSDKGRKAAG